MPKAKIDRTTVERVARLARIQIAPAEAKSLQRELNGILAWVDELNAIPTDGIEALTSIGPSALPMRADIVLDGNRVSDILENGPKTDDGFFLVPKVIE